MHEDEVRHGLATSIPINKDVIHAEEVLMAALGHDAVIGDQLIDHARDALGQRIPLQIKYAWPWHLFGAVRDRKTFRSHLTLP